MFLKVSQNSQEKACVRASFWLKFWIICKKGALRNFAKYTVKHLCQGCDFFKKEILAQLFSCEFCEILKNTFFTEHLRWLLLHLTIVERLDKKGKSVIFFELWKNQQWRKFCLEKLMKQDKPRLYFKIKI